MKAIDGVTLSCYGISTVVPLHKRVVHDRAHLDRSGTALRSDAYLQLMRTVALPDYGATLGNRGAFALRRRLEDHAEFIMLTLWDSHEAIERFAGPDATTAKYYDFDPDHLLEMAPRAEHFEVYDR